MDIANGYGLAMARQKEQSGQDIALATSQFTMGGMVLVSALVGLWSLACIIGGILHSSGPFSFIKGWFGAVFGN